MNADMNIDVGRPRVGQWYLHRDKGEMFQVTDYDEEARTAEVQSFDGDLDEIDDETWMALPLGLAEPPEDWTGPVDDVEVDDLGYSETDMTGADWAQPLEPFRLTKESWEDTTPEEERGTEDESERVSAEDPVFGSPPARIYLP